MLAEIQPKRPVMRYHGGKWKLAPWVISHFPAHKTYTEAFGGAGSVLLQKPRCYSEVYNDLDSEIVNLFQCLRSSVMATELERAVRFTPFAREEFNLAYEPAYDPIERARRLLVRAQMGFGSGGANISFRTGFRANTSRSGTTPAQDWQHYPDILPSIVERLKGVVIENRRAVDVIRHHDAKDTLHYVDPPYVHSTRKEHQQENYSCEMTNADHEELAQCLNTAKGMVILSGYDCDLYNDLYRGWRRVAKETHADGARDRTECLWLNPAAAMQQLQVEMTW